ncbi:MAG TPA: hypothetical protein VH352_23050 [Pseudonocardiaceae bacterium]|nr:hypothetical protein [Pseudonocardiaceae bacterium]
MNITLAVDVATDAARTFEILSTTAGQRAFWTDDCDVTADHARFGFPKAPVDDLCDVITEPAKLVRMHVTSGFPFWGGSTFEWELGAPARAESGTGVLFRHYGFGDGYAEIDMAHTAQTWALILDRLVKYAATGISQPFFTSES